MNIPNDLLYTKDHEWIKIEGQAGTIGITDYAQHALGDVTFVELPKVGAAAQQSKVFATVESVKAASDIFAPASGSVVEVNAKLEDAPGLINQSCYADGWIARISLKDISEKKNLLDPAAYRKLLEGLDH